MGVRELLRRGRFIDRVFAMRGVEWRMLRTGANGQPAAAAYCRREAGYHLHTLQVFDVTPAGVRHVVVFQDPRVFAVFGLAPRLRHGA